MISFATSCARREVIVIVAVVTKRIENNMVERSDKLLIDPKYIKKAKEKLGDQTAFIIAEELQLEDFDEKNLKGRCCFHQEDTPSMIFNPKTLSYHCFGCGRNTDILDAYMHNGCTYLQAVQKLFDLMPRWWNR
jgi:hypothetical protein